MTTQTTIKPCRWTPPCEQCGVTASKAKPRYSIERRDRQWLCRACVIANDRYASMGDHGGLTEVECIGCAWTLPAGRHPEYGTPERPIGADYCDAVMPRISAHIDGTGHQIRITLTTFYPDHYDQSSLILSPRPAPERTTTP